MTIGTTNKHLIHNIHEPLFTFAWDRAERVNLILFSEDGNEVLTVKKGKDFDILRGVREWDDNTLEDTARRVAIDHASATLDAVTICAVLSTQGELLCEVSYELVITAFVKSLGPRRAWQETECEFIDKETFLKRYRSGDREEMEVLIGMAEDFRVRRRTGKNYRELSQTKFSQKA
ncbi:MAG: hypothetical protein PHW63_00485 [Alphaproteobacteria bacterium]|nr:hypothetical protein [Alphaproteobacteria bacterium]